MKRNAVLCLVLCLCILFSALLSACTTPEQPEESSALSEESGEAVPSDPEDPNAEAVRAYLEELLTAEWEWETGSDLVVWISPDRLETIRDRVKQMKTPVLTEEDVLRVADLAGVFYSTAVEKKRAFFLPAYGPVREILASPSVSDPYLKHAMAYNALVAYTCYLFTPPDYIVREAELREADLSAIFMSPSSFDRADVSLCLPLAGSYTTRQEAVASVRQDGGCVLLYPPVIGHGEFPLDFSDCFLSADWLQPDGCRTLGLLEIAGDGILRFLKAPSYMREQADRLLHPTDAPWAPLYDEEGVLMPFSPEEARELREMADLCAEPYLLDFLMKDLARLLQEDARDCFDPELPILLPDADGTGEVLLEPGTMSTDGRLRRVMAYTVDLFTPRAYRFTDLTDHAGTYFATGNWISGMLTPEISRPSATPETMLENFYAGGLEFVLVTEDCELYLIDGAGNTEPLYVRTDGEA